MSKQSHLLHSSYSFPIALGLRNNHTHNPPQLSWKLLFPISSSRRVCQTQHWRWSAPLFIGLTPTPVEWETPAFHAFYWRGQEGLKQLFKNQVRKTILTSKVYFSLLLKSINIVIWKVETCNMCFRVFEPVTWAPPTPTSEPSSCFKNTELVLDYFSLQNMLPQQDGSYMMKLILESSLHKW